MQLSVVISAGLHALVLGWALFSLGAPKALEVSDVDAVPVSIVPFEDLTQSITGVSDAPALETPAPKPTTNRVKVEDAQNIGDNNVDLNNADKSKPSETEIVSKTPKNSEDIPRPVTENIPEPEPVREITPEPAQRSATATEIAALPKEATPVEPDPVANAIETSQPIAEKRVKLPKTGPVPVFREQTAPAKTAKSPQRKETQPAPKKQTASRESDFNSDDIASLLNQQDAQGGGAKRSQNEEALGAKNANDAPKLSQSELDALRSQIASKWNIIPGLADGGEIRITVSMELDRAGNIVGRPTIDASGGSASTRQTLAGSARRAVMRAQPYQLPAAKYDTWSKVVVNFDPSQLF